MAVIKFRRIAGGRAGSFNDKKVAEYTEAYFVQTDDAHDGPHVVANYVDCPRVGVTTYSDPANPLESNPKALCRKVDPKQQGRASKIWLVTVTYSTDAADPAKQSDNPLTKPPQRKFGFTKKKRTAAVDWFGHRVVNSANQPFDPGYEQDRNLLTYTVVFNLAPEAYSPAVQAAYMDATNSDVFMGFLPYQAAITEFSADEGYEQGVDFYRVTVQIVFDLETHFTPILDAGYYEIVSGKWKPITDDSHKDKVTTPFPLNGAGRKISAVSPPGAAPVSPLDVQVLDGTSGGNLAAGKYRMAHTYVYADGESAISPLSPAFTVQAGDVPDVVFPIESANQGINIKPDYEVPANVLTMNLYITTKNGGAHTLTQYATGLATSFSHYPASAAVPTGQPSPPIYCDPHYQLFLFLRPMPFTLLFLP